jgi:ribosomal protein L29
MAIIKNLDIVKMSNKECEEKIQDLRMELMKERVNVAKGGKNKIKEIKKTIARLLTFNRLNKSVEEK